LLADLRTSNWGLPAVLQALPAAWPQKNPPSLAPAPGGTGRRAARRGLQDYTEAMRQIHRPSAAAPSVPDPVDIGAAMARHQGLARLGLLMQESNRRLAIVGVALPGALKRFVKAGPIDEEGWTLLAANAAVAAKLRQLQPRLLELLAEQGIPAAKLRIKVLQQP
jgi:hypothetical protein